jgi:hypothetical protein
MKKKSDPQIRVVELHQESMKIFLRLEQIIDELKGIESREELNALPNIENWLYQLSGRAHVSGSPYNYALRSNFAQEVHNEKPAI